jgi:hypothetical protein
MGCTAEQHQQRALRRAGISVYSVLPDWVRGQITAIVIGMLSFEGAFPAQLVLPTGQTVLERLTADKTLAIGADG